MLHGWKDHSLDEFGRWSAEETKPIHQRERSCSAAPILASEPNMTYICAKIEGAESGTRTRTGVTPNGF
jgi:hypothetical protein